MGFEKQNVILHIRKKENLTERKRRNEKMSMKIHSEKRKARSILVQGRRLHTTQTVMSTRTARLLLTGEKLVFLCKMLFIFIAVH